MRGIEGQTSCGKWREKVVHGKDKETRIRTTYCRDKKERRQREEDIKRDKEDIKEGGKCLIRGN